MRRSRCACSSLPRGRRGRRGAHARNCAKRWRQQVVIENRPGAGGIIASQAAAQSPADGYTLILVATGHALNPYFYVKLPYDPFNDFAPISLVGFSPNILLVRSDLLFKSVADVLAGARQRPGYLS